MGDTMMDQHLTSIENPPTFDVSEDHTYAKSHMLNLMSGTEMDAALDEQDSHRPPTSSFLQTEAEVESGVEAQVQVNMKISATATAHAQAAAEALSMLGVQQ